MANDPEAYNAVRVPTVLVVLVMHAKLSALKHWGDGGLHLTPCPFFFLRPFVDHSLSAVSASVSVAKMSLKNENEPDALGQKHANNGPTRHSSTFGEHARGRQFSIDPEDHAMVVADQNLLHRDLKGRHMQMIAM